MSHHDWSDDKFDWKALNAGIDYLHAYMLKWGRIGVHSKEKYGTARIRVCFWHGSLHQLTHPGYVYSQYPNWLWNLDCLYIAPFVRFTRLPKLINMWQIRVYKAAYANAVAKWPHIAEELTCCADYRELLDLKSIKNKGAAND